jgi:hypothetical protein
MKIGEIPKTIAENAPTAINTENIFFTFFFKRLIIVVNTKAQTAIVIPLNALVTYWFSEKA